MTDSYHFESIAKFRTGGRYLTASGEVATIDFTHAGLLRGHTGPHRSGGQSWQPSGRYWNGVGRVGEMSLIPGELVQCDGQWVAADSIGPFPSGATLKVAGDKIVGRVEAGDYPDAWESLFNAKPGAIVQVRKPLPYTTRSEIATYDVSVGNRLLTASELLAGLREVLDALRAQDALPEPERDPLTWDTVTEFDPFKGFYDSPDARFTSGINCDVIERSPPTDSAYPAIAGLLRG